MGVDTPAEGAAVTYISERSCIREFWVIIIVVGSSSIRNRSAYAQPCILVRASRWQSVYAGRADALQYRTYVDEQKTDADDTTNSLTISSGSENSSTRMLRWTNEGMDANYEQQPLPAVAFAPWPIRTASGFWVVEAVAASACESMSLVLMSLRRM